MTEPFEWNVVVAGAWNPAILTPAWIQRRMFEKENALVQVQVPLDGPGPMSVTFEGVVVQVGGPVIVVAPSVCTLAALSTAARVAANAVRALPETPVSACGLNLRYRIVGEPRLPEVWRCGIDGALVEEGLQVQGRQLQRTLKFESEPLRSGLVNLIMSEDEAGANTVVINFHRATNESAGILEWLALSADSIRDCVRTLLKACSGIEENVT